MKVCDLTQFYSPVSGGVRRYIEQKAAYVKRNGRDQHVLIVPGETTGVSGDDTLKVYTIASPLVSRTSRYRVLLKLHLVEEVLERERPNIIESGDPYQLAWKAEASGRGLGIPVVGFYHSHFPEALLRTVEKFSSGLAPVIARDAARRYVKSLYNRFETTLVPSPALAKLLQSWGVEAVEGIDLGVDTSIFKPDSRPKWDLRRIWNIPEDRKILLFVGRLASEKNVSTLFSAFRLLPQGYHLVVAGDGTLRASLEKLRNDTAEVTWIPYCSDPGELANLYRSADLFVHPGIQETFGLVTLESQACGTPVVGIRGSYMDRIIFSGQTSWAAENTPESLAAAILGKFSMDLTRLGEEASKTVREQFSWERVFDRIFGIYRTVIQNYHD